MSPRGVDGLSIIGCLWNVANVSRQELNGRCSTLLPLIPSPRIFFSLQAFDAGTMPAQRLMDQPLEPHSPQLPPHVLSYRASVRAKQVQAANCTNCCTIL